MGLSKKQPPLAEVNRRWSPFRYAYDNPVIYIDPDGMLETDYFDENGGYMGSDKINDKKINIVNTPISPLSTPETNAFNPPN